MAHDKDDQLQPFFQQQGTNDPQYLKRYVQEHPENKMAWYLLGREYAAKGQQAKANYCFAQAGEVYAAFEESPSIQLTEMNADGQDAPARQEKASMLRTSRRILLGLAALFFLLYIPNDHYDEAHHSLPDKEMPVTPSSKETSPKSVETDHSAAKAGDNSDEVKTNVKLFYTSAASKTLPLEEAIKQIVMPESRKSDRSIVVQALTSRDKRWVNWTKQPVYLLSAMKSSKSGELNIVYHEAGRCNCQAEPDESVKTIYLSWNSMEEQKLILHSAITAYELINKRKPTKIEQLSGNYPNNILPGLTPMMKRLYTEYKGKNLLSSRPVLVDVPEQQQQPSKHGISKTVSLTSAAEPFTQPLEIIVDKLHHRLALVSGNIVIRNYAVGLGGSRTPEGGFTITEKVRNPNGKSSGDFGSRGMTLSNTLYAIHGTDEPSSIGKDRSKGCVRMKNEDIEELFDMAPLGTKVIIRKGGLPEELIKADRRFVMPAMNKETNPHKKYKWLS